MYWLLFYDLAEDYVAKRDEIRPEHMVHVHAAHDRGFLLMGGAFSDKVDGAVVVFKGDSSAEVEAWARADPLVTQGFVTSWSIRPWGLGIGAP